MLVAHNARFDMGFLDAELRRLRGRSLAGTVLDTVPLAKKLVPGRQRYSLASLADRFDTSATPCHRALPDALATAEILLALIGRAQERGAETVADLVTLSAPPARRAHAKRGLAEAAPRTPGTYVMRDASDRALYVGAAGDLRSRTLSYFRGAGTPRPVEQVLPAVERLEFREAGSPFEARLDEIGLIARAPPGREPPGHAARPAGLPAAGAGGPATARGRRRDRRRRGALRRPGRASRGGRRRRPGAPPGVRPAAPAGPRGPSRRAASRVGSVAASLPAAAPPEQAAHAAAAAALADALAGGCVPIGRLRQRRATLAAEHRFEEAARLRDAEVALRAAGSELRRVRTARSLHGVVLAAHRDPRLVAAFAVAYGLVVERRPLPRGGDASLEASALAASVDRAVSLGPGPEGADAVPSDRRDEALHVAAAFARPSSAHVAVTGTGAALATAVAAARGRV